MRELDIYVFGAGASFVHGAPLTNEILPYALTEPDLRDDNRLDPARRFLSEVFHFDAGGPAEPRDYPGLVDVLSVVDLAMDRRENLARDYDQDRLREVRRSLDYCIFTALEHSLSYRTTARRRSTATKELVEKLDPRTTAIISFNYDVIVDIALSRRHKKFDFRAADAERLAEVSEGLGIDYGVAFSNMPAPEAPREDFRLLKLHGSFNWLWSRVTGNLYFGGLSKAIAVLYDERAERALDLRGYYERARAPFAEETSDLEPILVTPTHLKDLRNVHLATLWRRAEESLRQARRVTFIGYSLPGDDIHIKYLFKRALETRYWNEAPEIIVVDYAKGTKVTTVQENYQRFFGRNVRYYRQGFEHYVREMRTNQESPRHPPGSRR